jgi:hypothetical protein
MMMMMMMMMMTMMMMMMMMMMIELTDTIYLLCGRLLTSLVFSYIFGIHCVLHQVT